MYLMLYIFVFVVNEKLYSLHCCHFFSLFVKVDDNYHILIIFGLYVGIFVCQNGKCTQFCHLGFKGG